MTAVLIFDTELTDRKEGEIIEAAWLRLRPDSDLVGESDRIAPGLVFEELFCQRYKPMKLTTFGALAVHHILPTELEGSPPSSTFALPADTTYLVGHSIDTDWQAAGAPEKVKRICTHALSQHTWPDADGYSQVALIYMLLGATDATRTEVRKAHGAVADVFLNRILLQHILQAKPDITTWSALWEYSEECRIPIYCPLKRWEGEKLEEMDDSSISWCLRQDWLDPYFRKGLRRVMEQRYPPRPLRPTPVHEAACATTRDLDEDDGIPF